VPDPYGSGVLVTVEPRQLQLGNPACPVHRVHDLQARWITSDRPEEPIAPCCRFGVIAGVEQGVEGERRITQPAVAVVPVPDATDLLRQGRGGGGDDSAGRV